MTYAVCVRVQMIDTIFTSLPTTPYEHVIVSRQRSAVRTTPPPLRKTKQNRSYENFFSKKKQVALGGIRPRDITCSRCVLYYCHRPLSLNGMYKSRSATRILHHCILSMVNVYMHTHLHCMRKLQPHMYKCVYLSSRFQIHNPPIRFTTRHTLQPPKPGDDSGMTYTAFQV